jgi:hypothetical protein
MDSYEVEGLGICGDDTLVTARRSRGGDPLVIRGDRIHWDSDPTPLFSHTTGEWDTMHGMCVVQGGKDVALGAGCFPILSCPFSFPFDTMFERRHVCVSVSVGARACGCVGVGVGCAVCVFLLFPLLLYLFPFLSLLPFLCASGPVHLHLPLSHGNLLIFLPLVYV